MTLYVRKDGGESRPKTRPTPNQTEKIYWRCFSSKFRKLFFLSNPRQFLGLVEVRHEKRYGDRDCYPRSLADGQDTGLCVGILYYGLFRTT